VPVVPLFACRSLGGWPMDASTFPRIFSAARPVRGGRAPRKHRRNNGGSIAQPPKKQPAHQGYQACQPSLR
ncbi:MAG TPA: hypothetical protein H9863_00855, partial [Candidatus Odoribacter faecigallinarum]|nr:hypothetical protein [Candidatus Odoribacter faecigallinarum]